VPDSQRQWPVLVAVAVGGVIGAEGRFGLQSVFPHPAGGFPWATLAINIAGSLLLGALMVLVTEVWPDRRLLRPFVGTGVLGGFTTFSSYTVEVQQAVTGGHLATAAAYLAGTLLAALVAVWAGTAITTRLVARR
jgi:CrcB protein